MTTSPRLWFATLGGMAAYAIHLVGNYWLVPAACVWGTRVPLYLFAAVLLVVATSATVVAVRLYRYAGAAQQRNAGAAVDQRMRFMGGVGALLGCLAVALILFGGAANFVFDPCQGTV